jgi:trehalose 2-sulfotransferase
LLSTGLWDTGAAGYPAERFPPNFGQPAVGLAQMDWVSEPIPHGRYDIEEDARYVDHVISLGTSPNGVFGVCIHWAQFGDAVNRLRSYTRAFNATVTEVVSLAFPNVKYIWLRRRDTAAQAVSWYRAIHSQEFVRLKGGPRAAHTTTPLDFDFGKIRTLASSLRCANNAWGRFFLDQSIQPLSLTYEDFASSYQSTLRSVLDFLNVPDTVVIGAPVLEKMADDVSRDWVHRFKVLSAS